MPSSFGSVNQLVNLTVPIPETQGVMNEMFVGQTKINSDLIWARYTQLLSNQSTFCICNT